MKKDFYKAAFSEMVEDLSENELSFLYTLMCKLMMAGSARK